MCRYIHDPILVKILRRYYIHLVFRAITCSDLGLWPLIPKANQHIDEPKYICDQNLVKFPLLGCETWHSQGFQVIAWCDLDVRTFDLMSMSQALIHTSPNFGEIGWKIYEDIVFTPFSGHCRLWPWPLAFWPQKLISTSMDRNTSVAKIGQNSLQWANSLWQTTIFMLTAYQFPRMWNEPQK